MNFKFNLSIFSIKTVIRVIMLAAFVFTALIGCNTPVSDNPESAKDFTVDFTNNIFPGGENTVVKVLDGGKAYEFTYGKNGHEYSWAKFQVKFPKGVSLADYEKVTFTIEGLEGDCKNKDIYLLAGKPLPSDNLLGYKTASFNVGSDNPEYTENEQNMTININKTKALGLKGTVDFCIYDHSKNDAKYKVKNVKFHIPVALGETLEITSDFGIELNAGSGTSPATNPFTLNNNTIFTFKFHPGSENYAKFSIHFTSDSAGQGNVKAGYDVWDPNPSGGEEGYPMIAAGTNFWTYTLANFTGGGGGFSNQYHEYSGEPVSGFYTITITKIVYHN